MARTVIALESSYCASATATVSASQASRASSFCLHVVSMIFPIMSLEYYNHIHAHFRAISKKYLVVQKSEYFHVFLL